MRAMERLREGTLPEREQDHAAATLAPMIQKEDGRIDWTRTAVEVHNLVRAVAPPFPGATTTIAGRPARVLRTRVGDTTDAGPPTLYASDDRLTIRCGGGGTLAILALEIDGEIVDPSTVRTRLGATVALDAD